MPLLRPAASDFTATVKAVAQYVAPGAAAAKASRSGGGMMSAPPSLGAIARASQVGALMLFTTSAVNIAGVTPPPSGGVPRTPVATIFTYTGADQVYTVPAGATTATVFMWGAGGAGGYQGKGGAGAALTGVLAISPGETLTIVVGQGGYRLDWPMTAGFGSYGGGGIGSDTFGGGPYHSIGGGRSAIRRSGADIVTIGAGGGASPGSTAVNTFGGAGSATGTGYNGNRGSLGAGDVYDGKGGSTTAGGAAGVGNPAYGPVTAGSLYMGGSSGDYCGSGGGGYYGGGGGTISAGNASIGGGGGGGSSLTTNLTGFVGYNSSDGFSAPFTASLYYNGTAAKGGLNGGGAGATGGNGLVVIFA